MVQRMYYQSSTGGDYNSPGMILAAADCGLDKRKPLPDLLKTAIFCKQWNCLPEMGGLMDQPAGMIEKMTRLLNIYRAHLAWKMTLNNEKGSFAKRHPDYWEIYNEVRRMRKELEDGGKSD